MYVAISLKGHILESQCRQRVEVAITPKREVLKIILYFIANNARII